MFIGTPPELDIALYTLCVVMDVKTCPISLDGQRFKILTYSFTQGANMKMIASGFPEI